MQKLLKVKNVLLGGVVVLTVLMPVLSLADNFVPVIGQNFTGSIQDVCGGLNPRPECMGAVGINHCDLDGDCDADMLDYQVFRSSLGSCTGEANFIPAADYDTDGCITYADFRIWYGCYRT
jgi:hypothetical protein